MPRDNVTFYTFTILVILSLNSQELFLFSFASLRLIRLVFEILASLRRWKLVWFDVSPVCCLFWYQPRCQFRPSISCTGIIGKLQNYSPCPPSFYCERWECELADFQILAWLSLTPWVICCSSVPSRASVTSLPPLLLPHVLCLIAPVSTFLSYFQTSGNPVDSWSCFSVFYIYSLLLGPPSVPGELLHIHESPTQISPP